MAGPTIRRGIRTTRSLTSGSSPLASSRASGRRGARRREATDRVRILASRAYAPYLRHIDDRGIQRGWRGPVRIGRDRCARERCVVTPMTWNVWIVRLQTAASTVPSASGAADATPSMLRMRSSADSGRLIVCSAEVTALSMTDICSAVLADQREPSCHEAPRYDAANVTRNDVNAMPNNRPASFGAVCQHHLQVRCGSWRPLSRRRDHRSLEPLRCRRPSAARGRPETPTGFEAVRRPAERDGRCARCSGRSVKSSERRTARYSKRNGIERVSCCTGSAITLRRQPCSATASFSVDVDAQVDARVAADQYQRAMPASLPANSPGRTLTCQDLAVRAVPA